MAESARSAQEHLAEIVAVLQDAMTVRTEDVAVLDSVGRILAHDVVANVDSPPFPNSQMDGYGLREGHLGGGEFPVGATIAAGVDPSEVITDADPHAVLPIMTGARVPEEIVAIVPVEQCTPPSFDQAEALEPARVHVPQTPKGQFVRAQGSDVAAGSVIAAAGTVVGPVLLAALLGQSVRTVSVASTPRVLLITGGKEITDAPGPASIPDSNGPMLQALARAWGIETVGRLRTNDDLEELRRDVDAAIAEHRPDFIVTSGGISHGRFEVIRQLLEPAGGWFGHVTQQPGGPQGLGTYSGIPVICLPGNPISTLVSFRRFVGPSVQQYIRVSVGAAEETAAVDVEEQTAILAEPIQGLNDPREQLRRGVHWVDDHGHVMVRPLGGPGSHLLLQAIEATCLLVVPSHADLAAGETVKVLKLPR